MAIDLCNKLIDNDLTRNELLERVEIKKTSIEDLVEICKILAKAFNLSSNAEAYYQLCNSKVLIDESVKLIDKESGRISRVFDTEINYEDSDADFDDEVFAEDLYSDAAEAELQMAGNYSPDKAVAYADKYWENYNPAYHNYNPDGGDCANFTSQCLYAGGLQMDSKWKASGTPLRGSVAWINATGLKNYLSENVGKSFDSHLNFSGSLTEVQKRVAKGDAVFYWNAKRNRYGHAAICVGTDSKGVPIVNAHNNNRYHVMWTLGYERCAVVNITAHGTSDGPSSNPAEPEPAKPAESIESAQSTKEEKGKEIGLLQKYIRFQF